MERPTRPIENGTAKKNTTPNPAAQGSVQNPRVNAGGPRSALRRPSDVRNQPTSTKAGTAGTQRKAPATRGAGLAQRQPIRQVKEDEGSGIVLGNVPVATESNKKQRKNDYIPTRKSRIKEPMPLATIVFSILCTVLVMFMMINFVKINEYTHDIANLQSDLQRLERQEQELTVELEKKNDLTGVDLEALGLVKEDSLKKVEITTDKDETVEHFEVEEEDNGVVATVMNALYRNFKEYRNIFFGGE